MTDRNEQDASVLDLEDLDHYLVLGVRKDTGEPVVLASPNINVPKMGALLGRAQADFQLQLVQAGMHAYMQYAAKAQKSSIIKGVQ